MTLVASSDSRSEYHFVFPAVARRRLVKPVQHLIDLGRWRFAHAVSDHQQALAVKEDVVIVRQSLTNLGLGQESGRQNLSLRMGMRRLTRLTNAFSKKLENHGHAVALYFMHYNFCAYLPAASSPFPKEPALSLHLSIN